MMTINHILVAFIVLLGARATSANPRSTCSWWHYRSEVFIDAQWDGECVSGLMEGSGNGTILMTSTEGDTLAINVRGTFSRGRANGYGEISDVDNSFEFRGNFSDGFPTDGICTFGGEEFDCTYDREKRRYNF